MATIDQFLAEIANILRTKDGPKLCDYLVLEPPLPPLYNVIVTELRAIYGPSKQNTLESQCKKLLPEDDEGEAGGSWTAFISFLVQYFAFLRDVNVDHLLETYNMLKSLLNHSILALSDASMGLVVLPTVISFSRTLARLAIGLDKRPDLIAHLIRRESTTVGEEAVERVTLVESTANVIREAFKKCLSERSGNVTGLDANGKPEGRRIGIYLCANLCLKLFFHCRKLRSAEQIFGNIYQQSPPLSKFPASQRVTFLYYLGRYLFANNHFFRGQSALQAAYEQCHSQAVKQRRSILVYLVASNIILGRFPSTKLLQRPEAIGLSEKFLPICQSIKIGNLASFRKLLVLESEFSTWFLKKRLLLQMRNRCEPLVWRSLARRTFLLSGFQGDHTKRAPSLELENLQVLGNYLSGFTNIPQDLGGNKQTNGNGPTEYSKHFDYVEPEFEDEVERDSYNVAIDMGEIESQVASLLQQGLLHGYISHKYLRFVITGAKTIPARQIGFPNVWNVIRATANSEIPGWVREDKSRAAAAPMVVNLTGARPAGAAPVE